MTGHPSVNGRGKPSTTMSSPATRSPPAAAWSYPQPTPTFSSIQDHIAFYPQAMDACWVDGERVTPQPGARRVRCATGYAPTRPSGARRRKREESCEVGCNAAAQASSMVAGSRPQVRDICPGGLACCTCVSASRPVALATVRVLSYAAQFVGPFKGEPGTMYW